MVKRYRVIPIKKATKLAAERGIKYYRIITHGGEKFRGAITKNQAQEGAYFDCFEIEKD